MFNEIFQLEQVELTNVSQRNVPRVDQNVYAGKIDAFLLVDIQHQTHSLVYLDRTKQIRIGIVKVVIHYFKSIGRVFGHHDHGPVKTIEPYIPK